MVDPHETQELELLRLSIHVQDSKKEKKEVGFLFVGIGVNMELRKRETDRERNEADGRIKRRGTTRTVGVNLELGNCPWNSSKLRRECGSMCSFLLDFSR